MISQNNAVIVKAQTLNGHNDTNNNTKSDQETTQSNQTISVNNSQSPVIAPLSGSAPNIANNLTLETSTNNSTLQTATSFLGPPYWTLIFYMSDTGGSDITGEINRDLYELNSAGSDANIKIYALIDYKNSADVAWHYNTPNNPTSIPLTAINPAWTSGEINSGDPNTLASWGKYCVDHNTAVRYAVIVEDHAAGIDGTNPDGSPPYDILTPCEMGKALSSIDAEIAIKNGGGEIVSLIGYDCCKEALVEIADELHDYAHAMVASEMNNWLNSGTSTWGYNDVIQNHLKPAPGTDPYELGNYFVMHYYSYVGVRDISGTLSVVNLDLMNTFDSNYLNPLTQHITNKWSLTLRSQIAAAASLTQNYSLPSGGGVHSSLDLRDFAYKIYQQVSDTTIKSDALALYNYLAVGAGIIYANAHWTGSYNYPDGTMPTNKASGIAINFCCGASTYLEGASNYKGERIVDQTRIQNDTCLDKFICAYEGLSTLPLWDNFTIMNIVDWQIYRSGNNIVQTDPSHGNVKTPSLNIHQSSDPVVVFTRHYFNQQGRIVVKASLNAGTTTPGCVFIVEDSVGHYCAYTGFYGTGSFGYYYNGNWNFVQSVSVNAWYQITLYIRPDTSTYDIYINGVCMKTNAPFNTPATGGYLNNVYFQAGNGNTETSDLWVDDLSVMAGNGLFQDHFATAPQQNGWAIITSGGRVTLAASLGYTALKCALLLKNQPTGAVAMYRSITPQTTHVVGEAAMEVDAINNCYAYFIMRTGGTSYNSVYFCMSAGTFKWCEGGIFKSTGLTYTTMKWYLITLDVNVITRTFDIYVDGSLIYAGASWYNQGQVSQIDAIYFQSQSATQPQTLGTWVDNVLVTT